MKICSHRAASIQTTPGFRPAILQRTLLSGAKLLIGLFLLLGLNAKAVIRDGGVDPDNLGQGGWLYIMSYATNKMYPNNIPSVTNEHSLFAFLKDQGLEYVIVKAATSNKLWTGSGNVPIGHPSAQFTSKLVNAAHANGLKIFGSNRSWGNDIPGEIAVVDYVFQQGADGYIYDAEAEWESSRPWIGTNGAALAWQLCSTVRSNWPTKFIAHNPFDTVYLHFSFPFKEFGFWCDAVMPQVYHHSASKGNAIAAIHWSDVHFKKLHDYYYTLPPTNINGIAVNWTNSIKPLVLMRDVYNGMSGTPKHPDTDVRDFLDYMVADPNCVTPGGYNGSDYFRSELHTTNQWAYIKAATIGNFPGVVKNIILDDAKTFKAGSWTHVKTIDATTSAVLFTGATGTDTNSFGTNYWVKGPGDGTSFVEFRPTVVTAGDYDVYQWHPFRADASSSVPFVINHSKGSTIVYANQQTNAGNWTLLGRFNFAVGTGGSIQVSDEFTGSTKVAMADGIKMVYAPPATPAPPSALIATAVSTNQINLSWTDNSLNETGFILFRSTTPGGPYTSVALRPSDSTNFAMTNLTDYTTYYFVVRATNALGASTNSNEASARTFAIAPGILSQPQSITVADGASASFSVTASGSPPLFYRWRFNGQTISGATNSIYTRSPVTFDDEGAYSVVITNAGGSITSSNANLTVASIAPSIVQEPANTNCNAGTTARFSVNVNGTLPLSFQWRRGPTALSNSGKISGATSPTLVITNVLRAEATNYSVVISNSLGAVTSAVATLTVNDPAINVHPLAHQTNLAGSTVSFTAVAAGTGPVTYRWRKDHAFLANGGNISGANTASLTIGNILKNDEGTNGYTLIVSNALGQATSSLAKLKVIDPIIATNPVSRTNIAGTTATFSVDAIGTAPLNFRWRKGSQFLEDTGNVSGAYTATLTLQNVSQADIGNYTVQIGNLFGSTTSTNASLMVYDPVIILAQPQSQLVYVGTNVQFSVEAIGTPPLRYQWQLNGTNLVGETGTSYAIASAQLDHIGDYSVTISNKAGILVSSNAFLQVNIPFLISDISVTESPTGVIINWTTTSNSTTQVEYGLTPDFGNFSAFSPAPMQNHSVLLTGLIPDTNYYFRVVSAVGASELKSETGTFSTLSSVIVDNPQAEINGSWTLSGSAGNYGGSFNYATSVNGAPTAEAIFTPNITTPGIYDVYLWFAPGPTRSTNVSVYFTYQGGTQQTTIDQSQGTSGWHLLASAKEFSAGSSALVSISNDTGEQNRLVIADAARWAYKGSQDNTAAGTVPAWWSDFYFGTNVNASLDPDGDGYSTYTEYILGTIPTEAASRLNFEVQTSSNTLSAVFSPRLDSRVYEVEESSNLSTWLPVSSSMVNTTKGQGSFTLPPATGNKFYRLKVRFE